ncbi:MAG: hypothetical protein P8Y60_12035 [Calditrichota bacterium]
MKNKNQPTSGDEKKKTRKWRLRKGEVLVVEESRTASHIIVVRDLKGLKDKITVLNEVMKKFKAEAGFV